MIAAAQRKQWDEDGFFLVRGFADAAVGEAMLERVIEISRSANGQILHDGFVVTPEQNLAGSVDAGADAELRVSKIFKLHRDGPFRAFIESPPILEIGRSLLGSRLDCFLWFSIDANTVDFLSGNWTVRLFADGAPLESPMAFSIRAGDAMMQDG
jgi:hypothetical protein